MGETPFTKDEFKTALEVQAKATEQMVLIASALKDITMELKEVHERLTNGAIKDIINGVSTNYNSVHKETINCMTKMLENQTTIIAKQKEVPDSVKEVVSNSSIAKDIEHVKWFIAIVGIIIVVATVLLRGIDNKFFTGAKEDVIKHMLTEHIKVTEPINITK